MQAQPESTTVDAQIRIYVADLAAYNAGRLHGVWIDATQEVDTIREQIAAMLARSPVTDAEEYAIHDSEGFGAYAASEHAGIDELHDVACFIEEFPEFGAALLDQSLSVEQARKVAEEDYCGCYTSLADYAQELTEETTDIPPSLAPYIAYDRLARDMELGGDVFTIEVAFNQVHIFWWR